MTPRTKCDNSLMTQAGVEGRSPGVWSWLCPNSLCDFGQGYLASRCPRLSHERGRPDQPDFCAATKYSAAVLVLPPEVEIQLIKGFDLLFCRGPVCLNGLTLNLPFRIVRPAGTCQGVHVADRVLLTTGKRIYWGTLALTV